MNWPAIPNLNTIATRLPLIFPEGIENRDFVIDERATRTLFVMFYLVAIEGEHRWARPSQVSDMSDEQAKLDSAKDRQDWEMKTLSNYNKRPQQPWYSKDARQDIMNETIKAGFVALGAIIERTGLPVKTPFPKHAMSKDFAKLFDEDLTGQSLLTAIEQWQKAHLK